MRQINHQVAFCRLLIFSPPLRSRRTPEVLQSLNQSWKVKGRGHMSVNHRCDQSDIRNAENRSQIISVATFRTTDKW